MPSNVTVAKARTEQVTADGTDRRVGRSRSSAMVSGSEPFGDPFDVCDDLSAATAGPRPRRSIINRASRFRHLTCGRLASGPDPPRRGSRNLSRRMPRPTRAGPGPLTGFVECLTRVCRPRLSPASLPDGLNSDRRRREINFYFRGKNVAGCVFMNAFHSFAPNSLPSIVPEFFHGFRLYIMIALPFTRIVDCVPVPAHGLNSFESAKQLTEIFLFTAVRERKSSGDVNCKVHGKPFEADSAPDHRVPRKIISTDFSLRPVAAFHGDRG